MKKCPQCSKELGSDAIQGLCPECLMKVGLGSCFPPLNIEQPSLDDLRERFPQLDILELLGRGGMGVVYKARQKHLDRFVAVKILPPGIGDAPAFAERFTREAKALAKLNHPNIVTLHEFGQADGLFYFIMEFVDGMNLRQLLQAGRIEAREALAIVPQICDALQYAHDAGIVHRDIKPENILLDRRGHVKVADFGLAKLVRCPTASDLSDMSDLSDVHSLHPEITEVGKVVGTPQYMAPEQVEHPGEVDHRADIYSLGVVFYQMLTGELPARKLEAPSSRMRGIVIDVRLDEVVLRALEREPELRYQSVSDVKTMVETIVTTSAPVPPVGTGEPPVHEQPKPTARVGWAQHIVMVGRRGGKAVINWPGVAQVFMIILALVQAGGAMFCAVINAQMDAKAVVMGLFGAVMATSVGLRRARTTPVERLMDLDIPVGRENMAAPDTLPRICWTAVLGAFFAVLCISGLFLQIKVAGIAATAVVTMLLGWIAISQIRQSAGKLYGMWLAVFEGVFFPLVVIGVATFYLYQEWQFKYKAFGPSTKYGILSPQYAYAELLSSHDQRTRDSALEQIVQKGMQSDSVIAKKLESVFGNRDLLSIPPMAALAMKRFDLLLYLRHPDSNQRIAALHASRSWPSGNKVKIVTQFLDDPDQNVVGQAIYELGYIGDSSVLELLLDHKFDRSNFIEEVRKVLQISQEQERAQVMARSVDEYLITGEIADNFSSIKSGGCLAAEILENVILTTNTMSRSEYERTKNDLISIQQSVRTDALRRLKLTPSNILNEVEQNLTTETNEDVIVALKDVRDSLRARGERLAVLRELLPTVYASAAEPILAARLKNLKEIRWDPRTVLFFTLTPYEVLKSLMPQNDAEGWGTFCLFLFYEHSGPALSFEQTGQVILVDALKQVSGDDLLKIATRIWPVELQPLHQSGSYFWTLRAAERSSTDAHNVVRMSVDRSLARPVVRHIQPFKEVRFNESGILQYIRWTDTIKVMDSWIKATEKKE